MAKLRKRSANLDFLLCYMCNQFHDCSVVNKFGERHCKISGSTIKTESIACDDFAKGEYFHCTKRNLQVGLKACYFIRKTKKEECGTKTTSAKNFASIYDICHNNCKQGQQIQKLFEHWDLTHGTISFVPYVPEKKKSKIKIKKRKPLLKRRKKL